MYTIICRDTDGRIWSSSCRDPSELPGLIKMIKDNSFKFITVAQNVAMTMFTENISTSIASLEQE